MKIDFDGTQQFQMDAIHSAIDLFKGQTLSAEKFEISSKFGQEQLFSTTVGFGNKLQIAKTQLLENLREVQSRNFLPVSEELNGDIVKYDSESQEFKLMDSAENDCWLVPHYSVEMETGTGKTYVYLRTILELNSVYGFTKFVIVVPSIAIREGVNNMLQITSEHFKSIYQNLPMNSWIYNSKNVSRLIEFGTNNQIQILIINVDAFNKKNVAIIHNEQDFTSGRKPIEFIQACNPIVIMDEPQNMESENARNAIVSLNPLCTLRYSATHRKNYNLIYRLGPIEAHDLGLVKRIEVDSVTDGTDYGSPYIHVKSVRNVSKTKIEARIEIFVNSKDFSEKKEIRIRNRGDDLKKLSENDIYDGFIVEEMRTDNNTISFSNGVTLEEGQTHGNRDDERMRLQIRETIREHFEKELIMSKMPEGKKIKILSLFFIDKVSNYRDNLGKPGKFSCWFKEYYNHFRKSNRYSSLIFDDVEKVHGGYFAQDKKGIYQDSRESTENQQDRDTYTLIMKSKLSLLSFDEPLKFIFSHSALREGWDNPNVFQICTLNETKSNLRKRQEIGRGLRLPVSEDGKRSFDRKINCLTVIANESYSDYANKLQVEIENDTGEQFGDRIKNKRDRRRVKLKKGWEVNPDFIEIWNRIKQKTRYAVFFSSDELVEKSSHLLSKYDPIEPPKFLVQKHELKFTREGISPELRASTDQQIAGESETGIPDLIGRIQNKTELTRKTIVKILIKSNRLDEVCVNPPVFLEQAISAIRHIMSELIADGIKYEKIDGDEYEMVLFEDEYEQNEVNRYLDKIIEVNKSIFNYVEFDSDVEKEFAEKLDKRNDINLFFKIPHWFTIKTPVGDYNPDWAIVKNDTKNNMKLYFIRETKGTTDENALRPLERWKFKCGWKHFKELDVDFNLAKEAEDI